MRVHKEEYGSIALHVSALQTMTRVIIMSELPFGTIAHRFEGRRYGGVDVSFFVGECPPGGGPVLHTPKRRFS